MQTENPRALLPCGHPSVDAVCPGVWRIALGTPSVLTPVALRELPPARGALEAMAVVALPPFSESLSWEKTARGFVVRFPVGDEEEFYGLGLQLKSLGQRGCKKTLRVNSDPPADAGDSHAPVPFLCSTAGWGLLVDTARYATFYVACVRPASALEPDASGKLADTTDALYAPTVASKAFVQIEIPHEAGVTLYLFGGPTLRDAVARYNLFAGGGCRPALKTLGVWYRAYGKANASEVEALLDGLQGDGIPCDVLGLEPGWQSVAYPCSFVWSDERFPDHAAFLARMRGRSMLVNCWEHAFVHPASPLAAAIRPHAGPSAVFGGLVPDLLVPAAREAFTARHAELMAGGVAGFKLDECDGSDFVKGPWSFPETDRFPSGADGECMHSLFGLAYQRTIDAVWRRANRRTLHSVRSSHALAAPYPFVLYSDLYDLRDFVRGVATASFSGLLWAPEVRDAATSDELVRRVQAAALAPQALVNAWYCPMPPWKQTDVARNAEGEVLPDAERITALVRDALRLRMRLLPYIDAAFARYAATGVPPCRALAMDFPDDANCRTCDDQWLLGEDLLVAPVVDAATTRKVVFPPGRWWTLEGDRWIEGGCVRTVDAPFAYLPVFVRDGALLPLAEPLPQVLSDVCFDLCVRVYGDGSRGATLVEDDGVALEGPANQVELRWDGERGSLHRTGSWPGRRFRVAGWQRGR